jgi:hypothetical protein
VRKWFGLFGASIVAVACGARSGLDVPPGQRANAVGSGGAPGAGGAGATTIASATGSSGTPGVTTGVGSSGGLGGAATGSGGATGVSTSSTGTGGVGGAPLDAGLDALEDAPLDAPADAPEDAPLDAPLDAPTDAPDDVVDAAPDVTPPNDCQDAGITYIYVMTEENALYRFYPPDLSFAQIGTIACPGAGSTQPFSMAVDRQGKAYVVFKDGRLYNVSTATAVCTPTSFQVGQGGFNPTFGMGFSSNKNDPGETLFVAEAATTERLATIDTTTLALSIVGPFSSPLGKAELTGTGDARLFAFGVQDPNPAIVGSHLAEIDKSTAAVISDTVLPTVGVNIVAWAFAFWGGDFYFFTSKNAGLSTVTRYHPDDGTVADVATLGKTIVGAGVSTCAPQ